MKKRMNHGYAVVATGTITCVVAFGSLSGCGSGDVGEGKSVGNRSALTAAPSKSIESHSAPTATQSREEWRKVMSKAPVPKKGCFEAHHPSTDWQEVPCATGHYITHGPPKAAGPRRSGAGSFNVGGGSQDNSATVSGGLITAAQGSFDPSFTTNVQTESTNGVPNSFSLQLNSDFFRTTVCNGAAVPGDCYGVQQFVFANPYLDYPDGFGRVLVESWLVSYNHSCFPGGHCPLCPTGWIQDGDTDCRLDNIDATPVPLVTIQNLTSLMLTGSANSSLDTATIDTGAGSLYAQASDSVLNLSQAWKFAEFNIFGNAGSTAAIFNTGATIAVKLQVSNGTTASPTCTFQSSTAETNNLNLVPSSCCPTGGAYPAIRFLESNASPLPMPPFCLLNDITPVLLPLQ